MSARFRKVCATAATVVVSLLVCHGFASAAVSPTGVDIVTENLFVLPAPVVHKVEVVEQLSVRNSSNTAQAFQYTVPDGASAMTADGNTIAGSRRTGQQLNLGRILPARKTTAVTLTWTLPLSSQQDAQFTLHADSPVYTANVFIPIGNSALTAEDLLTTTQTVTVSGTKFREFTRLGIPTGDDWTLSVQMLPSATSAPTTGGLTVIGSHPGTDGSSVGAVANLVMIALILMIGLMSIRATQWGQGARRKTAEDALVEGMVALHQQHERGMLDDLEFARQREQIAAKLKSLRGRA